MALTLVAGGLAAQEPGVADPGVPDVSGTWAVTQACDASPESDGTVDVTRWCDAQLTLEQRGDSLSGDWESRMEWGSVIQHLVGLIRPDGQLMLERVATDYPEDAPPAVTADTALVVSVVYSARVMEGRLVAGTQTTTLSHRGSVDRPWNADRQVVAASG